MNSKLNEMVELLKNEVEYPDHRMTVGMSSLETLKYVLRKARQLLAEEQKQAEGLVEEIAELRCIDCDGAEADCGSDGNENPCSDCSSKKEARKAAKQILAKNEVSK